MTESEWIKYSCPWCTGSIGVNTSIPKRSVTRFRCDCDRKVLIHHDHWGSWHVNRDEDYEPRKRLKLAPIDRWKIWVPEMGRPSPWQWHVEDVVRVQYGNVESDTEPETGAPTKGVLLTRRQNRHSACTDVHCKCPRCRRHLTWLTWDASIDAGHGSLRGVVLVDSKLKDRDDLDIIDGALRKKNYAAALIACRRCDTGTMFLLKGSTIARTANLEQAFEGPV